MKKIIKNKTVDDICICKKCRYLTNMPKDFYYKCYTPNCPARKKEAFIEKNRV